MKTLYEFLSNKVVNPIKEEFPEEGRIAYDWNDEEWIIDEYCYVEDKKKLNDLLRKYDESGVTEDSINNGEFEDDDIIVGARQKDSNRMSSIHGLRAAFLWDESSGLHYKH